VILSNIIGQTSLVSQKDIILKVLENLDFLTVLEYNISDV